MEEFKYHWENNEASFGPPIKDEVPGGAHVTFEIILKYGDKFIALRRPKGISGHKPPEKSKDYPGGLLYFCHDLIRKGESTEDCIKRIVKDQAGVGITGFKVIDFESLIQKGDGQWAMIPYVIAEVEEVPKPSSDVSEVAVFEKENPPDDFAWWEPGEVKEYLEEYV